jgi:outer membrane cobalamin receptor
MFSIVFKFKNLLIPGVLSVLLLLKPALAVDASSVIQLRVTALKTTAPIAGVLATLDPGGSSAVSDVNGSFKFSDVYPGSYSLHVSHVAYQDTSLLVEFLPGDKQQLFLQLHEIILPGKDLEFKGKSGSLINSEYLVLDEKSIQLRKHEDLPEILSSLPGVQILGGSAGNAQKLSIRGCRPDHVGVMLDGVLLNSGEGSSVDLASLPRENLKRIELIPGSSPLAGGYIGGLLKIYTNDAESFADGEFGLNSRIAGQAFGGRQLNISPQYSAAKYSIRAELGLNLQAGNFRYQDEFGIGRNRSANELSRKSKGLKIGSTFENESKLKLSIRNNSLDQQSPGPLFQSPTPDARHTSSSTLYNLTFVSAADHWLKSFTCWFENLERSYLSPAWQYHPEIETWVEHLAFDLQENGKKSGASLQLSPNLQDGRITKTLDLGVSRESFTSENYQARDVQIDRLDGTVNRDRAWLNLLLLKNIKSQIVELDISSSIRADRLVDKNDFASKEVSRMGGAVSVSLHPVFNRAVENLEVHFSAARSFAPAPFSASFMVESIYARGNPNLDPEKSLEYNIGSILKVFPNTLNNFSANLLLDFYGRKTADLIIWRANYRRQYFPDNLGAAKTSGMVLGLDMRLQSLNMLFTLTRQQALNRDKGSAYYGNRLQFQPDYYGSLRFAYTFKKLLFSTDYRFSGRKFSTESNLDSASLAGGLPAWQVLDIALNTEFLVTGATSYSLGAGIKNVLDMDYKLLDKMPMAGRRWWFALELRI